MKKAGQKKMIDGRMQFWCTQHKCPKGRHDVLYCNHDDAGHPEWQAKKYEFKASKKKNKTLGSTSGGKKPGGKNSNKNGRSFKLTERLKTALCTQGQMIAEQVKELLGQGLS